MEVLLARGGVADVNSRNADGFTLLSVAMGLPPTFARDARLALQLLTAGADPWLPCRLLPSTSSAEVGITHFEHILCELGDVELAKVCWQTCATPPQASSILTTVLWR